MKKLNISATLDYRVDSPTDMLLQLEVAATDGQRIEHAEIDIGGSTSERRVPAHDGIGERIWLAVAERLTVNYRATVAVDRTLLDCARLTATPPHDLPGDVTEYLFPSRYCPSDRFEAFVSNEFANLEGGARAMAIRDWVAGNFAYVPGSSDSDTCASESFVARQGICRDYAHVLITLARAADIPARFASVYAPGVTPPDFHAVAQLYLDGAWHLLDATGMADATDIAVVGIGRDAADVAFLTAFGATEMVGQQVRVTEQAAGGVDDMTKTEQAA